TPDSEGKFVFAALVPGAEYRIHISADEYSSYESEWEAQAGQAHQLPKVVLRRIDQAIGGVVVDPQGHAVSGIRVSCQSPRGEDAWLAFPLSHAVTDAEGHFRIVGLTKGRFRLTAYVQSPEMVANRPVPILASASVEAQAGQQDVRIVLKPPPEGRNAAIPVGKPPP